MTAAELSEHLYAASVLHIWSTVDALSDDGEAEFDRICADVKDMFGLEAIEAFRGTADFYAGVCTSLGLVDA